MDTLIFLIFTGFSSNQMIQIRMECAFNFRQKLGHKSRDAE